MKKTISLITVTIFSLPLLSQTAPNATLWNGNSYDGNFWGSGTPNYLLGHDGVNWRPANADRVRSFLGVPIGGETLQSVTDRSNSTANNINVGSGLNTLTLGGKTIQFYNAGSSAGTILVADDNGSIPAAQFSKIGATSVVNFPNGNVGIGTTAPTYKLHVAGMVYAGAKYGYRTYDPIDGGDSWEFGANNGSFCFKNVSNSSVPVSILSSGYVGIGTSNPSSELSVKGTITSKKVKVTQDGWADYVFDSSYRLTPLHELEKFIQLKKHLPEVPSTMEITKDGLDIGDNQVILLKKIEELTLYLIEQHKEIKQLKNRIEMFENKP